MFILKKKNEVKNEVNITIKLHSTVTNEDESLTELGLNILRNSMPKQIKLEMIHLRTDNLWQSIVNKFTKLSKIGSCMECFIVGFW